MCSRGRLKGSHKNYTDTVQVSTLLRTVAAHLIMVSVGRVFAVIWAIIVIVLALVQTTNNHHLNNTSSHEMIAVIIIIIIIINIMITSGRVPDLMTFLSGSRFSQTVLKRRTGDVEHGHKHRHGLATLHRLMYLGW